jgi:hypothetical protein
MTTFMFFWGLETPVGLRNMGTSDLLEGLLNNAFTHGQLGTVAAIMQGEL